MNCKKDVVKMYDILICRIKAMSEFKPEPVLVSSSDNCVEYELEPINSNYTSIASIVINLLGTQYSNELVDSNNSSVIILKQPRILINNKLVGSLIKLVRLSNVKYRITMQITSNVKFNDFGEEILSI